MTDKVVNFTVGMTCGGCSGAVTRILSKIQGVKSVDANVETKNVAVTCEESVITTTLLEALQKWLISLREVHLKLRKFYERAYMEYRLDCSTV